METDQPKISVVVPAFNAVTTIERALRSVAQQNYSNLEVIVVDDASVDDTTCLVRSFEGIDIRLIESRDNLGAAGARNLAIKEATGELIAFLDADDEWLPGKLDAQMGALLQHPDSIFVTCEASLLGPGGRPIGLINPNRPRPNGFDGWKLLLKHPCVATPCVLAKRQSILDVGLFDPSLASGEDQDLWIRLAMLGRVTHVDQVFVNVYDTGNSLSKRERHHSVEAILPIIERHISNRRADLSAAEVDGILATRLQGIGRVHCESGRYRTGVRYLREAARKGNEPWRNLIYVIQNAPGVRPLKRAISPPRLPSYHQVNLTPVEKPQLLVVVDTEEEFDWSKPFSTKNRSTESIFYQDPAQALFEDVGLKPTYVLDYPIVENTKSVDVIKSYFDRDACSVGAHLQPWVNPPYHEELSNFHSYPGNLSYVSEYQKLKELTEQIEKEFSHRPRIYKAGRYGFGPATPKILKSLGYTIDVSIVPHTDFRNVEGFDFSSFRNEPVWLGDDLDLLEIPLTRGFAGFLAPLGPRIFPMAESALGSRLHVPGLLARLGLLERITLTPEGMSLPELIRLTRKMIAGGRRIFCLTYHSSTLMPGGSPYVQSEEERKAFLERIGGYLDFFFGDCEGTAITPHILLKQASDLREFKG